MHWDRALFFGSKSGGGVGPCLLKWRRLLRRTSDHQRCTGRRWDRIWSVVFYWRLRDSRENRESWWSRELWPRISWISVGTKFSYGCSTFFFVLKWEAAALVGAEAENFLCWNRNGSDGSRDHNAHLRLCFDECHGFRFLNSLIKLYRITDVIVETLTLSQKRSPCELRYSTWLLDTCINFCRLSTAVFIVLLPRP